MCEWQSVRSQLVAHLVTGIISVWTCYLPVDAVPSWHSPALPAQHGLKEAAGDCSFVLGCSALHDLVLAFNAALGAGKHAELLSRSPNPPWRLPGTQEITKHAARSQGIKRKTRRGSCIRLDHWAPAQCRRRSSGRRTPMQRLQRWLLGRAASGSTAVPYKKVSDEDEAASELARLVAEGAAPPAPRGGSQATRHAQAAGAVEHLVVGAAERRTSACMLREFSLYVCVAPGSLCRTAASPGLDMHVACSVP